MSHYRITFSTDAESTVTKTHRPAITAGDLTTLQRMARAAAYQANRHASDDERAECAAHLVSAIIADGYQANRPCQCGGPAIHRVTLTGPAAGMLPALHLCIRCARGVRAARRLADPAMALPSYSTLYGMASNWRRTDVRRRERDHKFGQSADMVRPAIIDPDEERDALNRYRSADRASAILDQLGADPTGPLFPVAYAAVRRYVEHAPDGNGVLVRDADQETAAQELGMSTSALKNLHKSARIVAAIPSAELSAFTVRDHAGAVTAVPDHAVTTKTTRGANLGWTLSGSMGLREGIDQEEHAPITVDRLNPTDTVLKRRAAQTRIPAWVATDGFPSADKPGEWTRIPLLPAVTAARLEQGVRVKRERATARTTEERNAVRVAAGIPGTVR